MNSTSQTANKAKGASMETSVLVWDLETVQIFGVLPRPTTLRAKMTTKYARQWATNFLSTSTIRLLASAL